MTLQEFIKQTKNNYIVSNYPKIIQSLALVDLYFTLVFELSFDLGLLVEKETSAIGDVVKLSDTHFGIVAEIHDEFIRVLEQNYNGQGQGLGCNAVRISDYFFKKIPEQIYKIQAFYNI